METRYAAVWCCRPPAPALRSRSAGRRAVLISAVDEPWTLLGSLPWGRTDRSLGEALARAIDFLFRTWAGVTAVSSLRGRNPGPPTKSQFNTARFCCLKWPQTIDDTVIPARWR